ncbi:hypothetical protein CLG85_015975 [Yangia mangrovi]|uniref:Uncharacterized protein n=1 Tax=Alloyangia mangrovi TaxID=1779329 RepID=A0A2A3JYT9_9RHOB|nr:hypothetical protein [Alloyangia mangrovi]MCT4371734.1 hypothetical protein [Alloyangia mangrovi]
MDALIGVSRLTPDTTRRVAGVAEIMAHGGLHRKKRPLDCVAVPHRADFTPDFMGGAFGHFN